MEKSKTSTQYKLVKGLFKLIGVNKMLAKEGDDFTALLNKYAEKQKVPLKVPYKKMKDRFDIEKRDVEGTVCYVVRNKDRKPDKAILYFFGGGYILPPDPGDIVLCGQMAENCNAEVWFPIYPMAPKNKLIDTVKSSLNIYRCILENYTAENTRFFGTSSGGGLAMSLCMYIVHENVQISLPGRLVLQSPGLQVPPSEEQKMQMENLKDKDVMIPPRFFDNIAPVLATGEEAYLLSPLLFDLSGFPPIDIFYGTDEVMIAFLRDMEKKCRECGVDLNVHIGEGMMHCWGAMEFVPEAKQVRREYFEALSRRN